MARNIFIVNAEIVDANGTYNVLFIRREVYVDHDPTIDTYKFYTYHDDDYKVYLNGTLFDSQNGWSSDFNNYREVNIPSSCLKVGSNVLAGQIQQNWGGAYFDCGVLLTEGTQHTVTLINDWQSYIAPGHNFDFSTIAVKAYRVAEIIGTSAHLEEVTSVPADEPIIVRPDNGAGTYQIPVTQDAVTIGNNELKAATESFTVTSANTI